MFVFAFVSVCLFVFVVVTVLVFLFDIELNNGSASSVVHACACVCHCVCTQMPGYINECLILCVSTYNLSDGQCPSLLVEPSRFARYRLRARLGSAQLVPLLSNSMHPVSVCVGFLLTKLDVARMCPCLNLRVHCRHMLRPRRVDSNGALVRFDDGRAKKKNVLWVCVRKGDFLKTVREK